MEAQKEAVPEGTSHCCSGNLGTHKQAESTEANGVLLRGTSEAKSPQKCECNMLDTQEQISGLIERQ